MLEAEESSAKLYFSSHLATQAKSQVTHETLYLDDFKCGISSSLPYYIYPHYPQNYEKTIKKKNHKEVSTTHPPLLERATHPKVRKSL